MRLCLSSRTMLGCMVGLFATASLGLFATACYVLAQQPEPKQASLPDGLRHVPPDALGFIHLRVGAFLQSDLGSKLLKELQQDKNTQKGLQGIEREIEQKLGVQLVDLESVTLVMLNAPTAAQIQAFELHRNGTPRRAPFGQDFKDGRFMDKKWADFPPKDEMRKEPFEKKADGIFKERFEEKKIDELTFEATELSFQPGRFGQPMHDHDMEIERNAMALQYLAFSGPLMMVTSTKPLDRKRILASQLFEQSGQGSISRHGSMLFLSDRTLLLGNASEIERFSEQAARKPGPKATPMHSALALAANPHLVIAGGHVPAAVRQSLSLQPGFAFGELFRVLALLSPLMQSEAGLTLDLGKNLDLTLQFNGTTEASAEQTLQAVKSLRVLAELAIEKGREAGEPGGWKLTLENQLKQALADAVIEQKGTTVRAHFKMEFDSALVNRFTKEYVATMRAKVDRTQSINDLKQIGLAMHGYMDANRRLPPAGLTSINDPTGKPLLSWRVAILPYIEQGALYQQFDHNQPWDHPTNKKLISRMPQIYAVPGTESKSGLTHYRVFVGPQTMFEPGQRITLAGITDGTSNTIMTVEAKEPTVWTRPDDLPFDPKGALPKLGISPDGFLAGFGDGTVRFLRANTPPEMLRAFITRNGGEVVTLPD